MLGLAIRDLSIVDLAGVDSVGAQVVLDIAGTNEGSIQVVKRRVAIDLEWSVAAYIVDGWGSGTEVAVKVLEVLW